VPRVGDEGLAVDGSEYLLGDDVTSETDVETGLVLQHGELSSAQEHNQLNCCLLTNISSTNLKCFNSATLKFSDSVILNPVV